jgi:lantibiotic modifying enzyme
MSMSAAGVPETSVAVSGLVVTVAEAVAATSRWSGGAARIGRAVAAQAHRLGDGGAVWRAAVDQAPGERPVLLGPHLYDGSCGVAFFLAARHWAEGEPGDRDLALAAVAPLRRKLRQVCADPQRAAALRLGVGGLVGVASFLYTFTRLAVWLDDEDLLADAAGCLSLVDAGRIAADDRFDVMSGCAGAVLALLVFEAEAQAAGERQAAEAALTAAAACAERLLTARVSWRGRALAWPGPDGRPPLSGFAHGAAGIAHALLRLHRRTGDAACLDAARQAYAFERSLFLPEVDGWLDPRFDRPVEQSAWCHGTPGIVLGRVGELGIADDPETRDEVRRLLQATLVQPSMSRDHLCCGNACRVEILHTAALALGRDDLTAAAHGLAAEMLDRAEAAGGFVVDGSGGGEAPIPDRPSPTLFLGLAGIGYTLLRLVHAERLPCLLLMD